MGIEAKHAYRFEYLKSEKWSTVRIEALAREKGKCQICGEESIHNDAHHVWYPESIWDTTEAHLVVLCRPCHDFIHSMIPECKTNDEVVGRGHWNKFRNAIMVWFISKSPIMKDVAEESGVTPGIKALRGAYEKLKNRSKELELVIVEYNNQFGNVEGIEELLRNGKKKKPQKAPESSIEGDIRDLAVHILHWVKKRGGSFVDFPVDNPDYQI